MSPLIWIKADRDQLPELLFGRIGPDQLKSGMVINPNNVMNGLVNLGYSSNIPVDDYLIPSILVIPDVYSAETFSWLKVYAPETFPLSQFCRVIKESELNLYYNLESEIEKGVQRTDRWASVILGEALSQSEQEIEIQNLPLSRAVGCFSTTFARAAIFHGFETAVKVCTDRLRMLEQDRRFVRRPVAVDELLPIWAMAGSQFGKAVSEIEAPMLVMQTLASSEQARGLPWGIEDFPGLVSDSVEERVVTFHRLAAFLSNGSHTGSGRRLASVALAVGAFLVGRSTSHVFLLRRYSKAFPSVFAWFGLIASLSGPESWDPVWARALKGIEKFPRAKFDWGDSPSADLSWAEFVWLSDTFDRIDILSELPKLLPSALSIEVLPGASCQLRLVSVAGSESESPQQSGIVTNREKELEAVLAQFFNLAARAKNMLEKRVEPVQKSLALGDDETSFKVTRSRRPKRTEDKF